MCPEDTSSGERILVGVDFTDAPAGTPRFRIYLVDTWFTSVRSKLSLCKTFT